MDSQPDRKSDLPEYDNPPVTEVVCGVLFKTLDGFQIPHFGLFWEYFKKEYPACQEVAPLMPLLEKFDVEAEEVQFNEIPLPRVWFTHRDETGIIQLQRDRFLHNWKKSKLSDSYPRYHVVIDLFKRHLDTFEAFLKEQKIGRIDPLQYEMTYVNHIPQGDGWNQLSDLGRVFRDYHWDSKKRFLPEFEHLNLRKSFRLPENKGRLHVSIRDARRRDDEKPILLFELTVRGFPVDQSREAMWGWFDVAREWIVRGFTDLTADEIQKKTWKKTR
jgi:uncharacterized protein (TIGR04255 family)